ncbi:hypothetical protein F0L68_02525 [Solihabitans fulvus]|uniref:Trypsin n=1 Tax=Solihabitans fulvus TaxID=1892852 RepID=A0A5B2XSX0_9PSEU|nr:hypothetical protein [Solihabitans fulvus]KAA2266020.1 hypothetical protein F0L68_02525 [Solihabitans fulvus]
MSRITAARWGAALLMVVGLVSASGAAEAAGTPTTSPFGGMPAVGALTTGGGPISDHNCSASIVDSPHGNLIMGAAHCMAGKSGMTFAPGYHDGVAPYGVWKTIGTSFVPDGWPGGDPSGGGSPYDVAFAMVESHAGQSVQQTAGSALHLRVNTTLPQPVTVVGYPGATHTDYQKKPYKCDATASAYKQSWITLQCLKIPGGFSGGPWIVRGTMDVIGVIGGYGQSLPDSDPNNYSINFGNGVQVAYDRAVAATNGPPPPYSMGTGATWKHADLITSGYYTGGSAGGSRHMDMIVRWSDGEVTLYRGSTSNDGRHPFESEMQLSAPGGLWTHAILMTGGHFADGGDGLVVRWSDGELTLYKHVDQNGFHDEVQLAAPNDLWKNHSKLLTAGKYTSSTQRGDLVVVWSDGEVSLYGNIGANGLGAETQLAAPNDRWKGAVQLTAGEFTGNNTADLAVRWGNGTFSVFPDVNTAGFNGEYSVAAPNTSWNNATVVAAGAFASNGRPNDILIRWVDGEVSLYPSVDWSGLHQEIQLVAP